MAMILTTHLTPYTLCYGDKACPCYKTYLGNQTKRGGICMPPRRLLKE
jgi:hypothetical protein